MDLSKAKIYSILIAILTIILLLGIFYVNFKTKQLSVASQVNLNLGVEVRTLQLEVDNYTSGDSSTDKLISQIDNTLSNLDSVKSKYLTELKGSNGTLLPYWTTYDDISVKLTKLKGYLEESPEEDEVKDMFVEFAQSVKSHLMVSAELVEII